MGHCERWKIHQDMGKNINPLVPPGKIKNNSLTISLFTGKVSTPFEEPGFKIFEATTK